MYPTVRQLSDSIVSLGTAVLVHPFQSCSIEMMTVLRGRVSADYRVDVGVFGLWISGFGFGTLYSDFGLNISDFGFRISNLGFYN